MIDVNEVTALQRDLTALWHEQEVANPCQGFLQLVCEQHKFNFLLWHEEDIARSPEAPDSAIAAVKRKIDRYNQDRNNWIERLDVALAEQLRQRGIVPAAAAPWNTETPGSAIDRLSILSLRWYHMAEQAVRADATAEHRAAAAAKLATLREQHADLSTALAKLVDDLLASRKQLKLYRQFKMYNDPAMNPYLYKAGHAAARAT